MSVDKTKELEAEYERLKAAATKELSEAGTNDGYASVQLARTRVGEFCLTSGQDLKLLQPRFNEEDLAFANVGG